MKLSPFIFVLVFLLLCFDKTQGWRRRRRRRCVYCSIAWGPWSQCSASCGNTGTMSRRARITQWPTCGRCPALVQNQRCNRKCCPVACSYYWGGWSACSGCGWSTQTRNMIIRRGPVCGGRPCPSQRTQTQRCNTGK